MNYASGASYHPSGQLSFVSYGNGLSYSASFNARQQMIDLSVSRSGLNALDFSYNYDANGRVTLVTDHAVSGQNRSFSYDGLGRLATASGPWGAGSYTYDLLNNIRSKTLGPHTVEIEYNADNQIHRARDTRDGNIWRLYGHDARGNVIDNSRLQFTYDRSDQPTAISGAATGSFVYDAHNRRVKQVINGETIYTVYSLSGAILYRDNVTAGEATDYIRMGGRTIARLTNGVATYPHSDHLGSAAAATDASGNLLWREDYTPFGEPRQAPAGNADDEGFTGHIHDADTGLTYMQARYYDPVIGRFLSNDPVGFAEGGPGYFNRYAYTANDPVNFIDPDGLYRRGDGFTDEEWAKFDALQKQTADDMQAAGERLVSVARALADSADPDDQSAAKGLFEEAIYLLSGAEVLRGSAHAANAGDLPDGVAGAVNSETGDVTIDLDHSAWSSNDSFPVGNFAIGHESLHSAGLPTHATDTIRPGVAAQAYRFGNADQRRAFSNIPTGSSRARRNPDHLMSRVYP